MRVNSRYEIFTKVSRRSIYNRSFGPYLEKGNFRLFSIHRIGNYNKNIFNKIKQILSNIK